MRKRFTSMLALAFAASLTCALFLRAQESADPAADAEEEEAATPAPAKTGAGKRPGTMGKDKVGIEGYLRHRLAAIKTSTKHRLDFVGKDNTEWANFWNKVKEERNLFEVRIARQRLDLFESLGSLDQREHANTISDFERLQANQIRAFENAQRQKMDDFFMARQKRWKDYYAAQERDRLSFAAEVDASWSQLKTALKLKGGSGSSSGSGSGSQPSTPRRF